MLSTCTSGSLCCWISLLTDAALRALLHAELTVEGISVDGSPSEQLRSSSEAFLGEICGTD